MKSLFEISASKIEVTWKMGDSIPHSVPFRFLLGSYSVPISPLYFTFTIPGTSDVFLNLCLVNLYSLGKVITIGDL
jgi:hypothetical protein